ncbi:hypothetical protein WAI453_010960 [Rhynchosporium graminicola]
MFGILGKELVMKCKVQRNGTPEDDERILPEGLIEKVAAIRNLTLKKLWAIPYGQINNLETQDVSIYGKKSCHATLKSSLILKLTNCGLWPRQEPKSFNDSVATIAGLIKNLQVQWLGNERNRQDSSVLDSGYSRRGYHYDCGVNYEREVEKILNAIQDPTLDRHV